MDSTAPLLSGSPSWLVHNLHHSRISPSIQVMAKGIIKQAGTHVLDLDEENGEFLPLPNCRCPGRLGSCGRQTGCCHINTGICISTSAKIWERFELSFLCLCLSFAQICSNSLCQLSFFCHCICGAPMLLEDTERQSVFRS